MHIFSGTSYKTIIKQAVEDKKAVVGAAAFSFQGLAAACGVQKTYLSRVLNGAGHLNSDQLFLGLSYLGLSRDESGYVMLLHEWERSGVPARRKVLEEELRQARLANTKTEKHLETDVSLNDKTDSTAYYLNVNAQLVHMFLTIPQYAEAPTTITEALGISDAAMTGILRLLSQLGIITYKGSRIVVLRDSLHLPKDAPLTTPYRTMMRLKALERLQNDAPHEPYAYSLFFSADEDARAAIQGLFFEFLKKAEKIIRPATCERVYQMQFDLIDWSKN